MVPSTGISHSSLGLKRHKSVSKSLPDHNYSKSKMSSESSEQSSQESLDTSQESMVVVSSSLTSPVSSPPVLSPVTSPTFPRYKRVTSSPCVAGMVVSTPETPFSTQSPVFAGISGRSGDQQQTRRPSSSFSMEAILGDVISKELLDKKRLEVDGEGEKSKDRSPILPPKLTSQQEKVEVMDEERDEDIGKQDQKSDETQKDTEDSEDLFSALKKQETSTEIAALDLNVPSLAKPRVQTKTSPPLPLLRKWATDIPLSDTTSAPPILERMEADPQKTDPLVRQQEATPPPPPIVAEEAPEVVSGDTDLQGEDKVTTPQDTECEMPVLEAPTAGDGKNVPIKPHEAVNKISEPTAELPMETSDIKPESEGQIVDIKSPPKEDRNAGEKDKEQEGIKTEPNQAEPNVTPASNSDEVKKEAESGAVSPSAVSVEAVPPESLDDEGRYMALMQRCIDGFMLCLSRFPQHYKSLYRLAYIYYHSDKHKVPLSPTHIVLI